MSRRRARRASAWGSRNAADDRLLVVALSVLAVVQATLVLVSSGGIVIRTVAVGLAIAGVFVRLPVLTIFAALLVTNFGMHLAGLPAPFPNRLAHIAILAMYAATGLAGIAATVLKVRFAPALAIASVLAVAVVASEALISRIVPPSVVAQAEVKWIGGPQPDPLLGEIYPPYAILQTLYPDNRRGYFEQTRPLPTESSPVQYSVTYSLNALGCRGRDYPIPKPRGRHRILVLGNSSAFGVGVHEQDTFSQRLEQSLSAPPQEPSDKGDDVINCGAPGYSTRAQREFYGQIAFRYEPDVVLVAMSDRDNLSRSEELQRGFVHESARYESLLLWAHLIQYARHEGRRPFEYSNAVEELVKLNDACRVRDARLAVVIFRNVDASPHWRDLETAVSGKLQPLGIPFLDLGLTLLKDHAAADLTVHPLDANPNEIAHRIAAEEIERLLKRHGLTGRPSPGHSSVTIREVPSRS